MLLIDKVTEIGSDYIVGVKNVTMNEPFFTGHFPDEPIMPGVLLVEAMSQCGALFILNQLEEPAKHSTYFVKIDKIVFHKKVVPGDTLIMKVEQTAPLRHGLAVMKGYLFVGEKLAAEASFIGQITKNKE
jgi:UDP-3-O-[3-hydroxymyristoyl] N-acetylglucosamine deacetylase/3-hydroxyacyl-[acyl-carrier-protein] dehydratase